jgi:DNA-binding MarR family transcriptional regulator
MELEESSHVFLAALRGWMEVYTRHSISYFSVFAKDHDLSLSQLSALFQIRYKGCFAVSDLGESLGITAAAASQMLERLANEGLVTRSEDPHDRRVKQIRLTPLGESTLNESILTHKSWLEHLASSLTEEERCQVAAALKLLSERAEQLDSALEPALEAQA